MSKKQNQKICKRCEHFLHILGMGFTGETTYKCMHYDIKIDSPDHICEPPFKFGKPGYGTYNIEIDIGSEAKTHGWCD